MSRASLREFISSVLVRKRLRFGDLRRLQRDVLPTGIATREEAEALITLDQALSKADVDWPAYLTTAVRDFVVSTSNPARCVDGETAAWLVSQLSSSQPRTALAIAREIVLEANEVDEVLLSFVESHRRKPKPSLPGSAFTPHDGRTLEALGTLEQSGRNECSLSA